MHYRTSSHAGFPKGSYLIPNPIHFHIAYERQIAIRRPQITSIASCSKYPQHPLVNNKYSKITMNFDNSHSVSLNIPFGVMTGFIFPFANALNMKTTPDLRNKGSQTSYNSDCMSPNLSKRDNIVTYTPLFVDSYQTCQVEQESTAKSKLYETRFLEYLQHEIHKESFSSDNSDSENELTSFSDRMYKTSNSCFDISKDDHEPITSDLGICSMNSFEYEHLSNTKEVHKKSYNTKNYEKIDEFNAHEELHEIVVKLSNVLKEYIKKQCKATKELIAVSRIMHTDEEKLMNDLMCIYTTFNKGLISPVKQHKLRTAVAASTSNELEVENKQTVFNEIFDVSELLNDILNHFFDLVPYSNFTRHLTTENHSSCESTPKRQRKLENNQNLNTDLNFVPLLNTTPKQRSEYTISKKSEQLFSNTCSANKGYPLTDFTDTDFRTVTPEANILQNSANFLRTSVSKSSSYVQNKTSIFTVNNLEDKENRSSHDDSGNWMGYEHAKF